MPIAVMFISAYSIQCGETQTHHLEKMKTLGPPFIEIDHNTAKIIRREMTEYEMSGTEDFFIIKLEEPQENALMVQIGDRAVRQFIKKIRRYRIGLDFGIGYWVIYMTFNRQDVCEAYEIA